MVSQLILLPNVAAHYCWHVWDHESVCIEVRVFINRIWEKMSLTTFALPRDYVVFLSSGGSLTVKCPQGKSPQAGGRRGRGALEECFLQVRVKRLSICWKCVCLQSILQGLYSLEFLKKSWNLQSNFPDLEKVWKIEIKSGIMANSLNNKSLRSEFVPPWSNLAHSRDIQSHNEKCQNLLISALQRGYFTMYLSDASWKKLGSGVFQGLCWSPIKFTGIKK